jgi:hypothetical protein
MFYAEFCIFFHTVTEIFSRFTLFANDVIVNVNLFETKNEFPYCLHLHYTLRQKIVATHRMPKVLFVS